jgi:hypothetical protein
VLRRLTRWRELGGLLVLVLLASCAVSSTSLLLSGSLNAFATSAGTGNDVVILSGGGRVPQTGALELNQVGNVTRLPGVKWASPEVYAPVDMGGVVRVVRGVNFTEFSAVQPVTLTSGSLSGLGGDSVYVGEHLAQTAGTRPGATFLLQGLLANTSLTAKVSAVVSAGAPYDDEIISSLQDARILRGMGQGQVTFLRLKVDPSAFNMTLLLQIVRGKAAGGSGANPFLQQLQLAPTTSLISIVPRGSSAPSITTVLGRGLGLVQAVFQSLDVVVLLASGLAVYFATSYWLNGTRPTQDTLSALGMGKGRLRVWLLAVTVPPSVLAGVLGYLVAYWGIGSLSATGGFEFFFHHLMVPLDPASIVISWAGPAVAVAAAVVAGTARLAPESPCRLGESDSASL